MFCCWRPQGDSNPCRRRERPVSWTWLDDGDAMRKVVVGGGFEPPKALPADLQSAPFDHSGTPPLFYGSEPVHRVHLQVNGEASFNKSALKFQAQMLGRCIKIPLFEWRLIRHCGRIPCSVRPDQLRRCSCHRDRAGDFPNHHRRRPVLQIDPHRPALPGSLVRLRQTPRDPQTQRRPAALPFHRVCRILCSARPARSRQCNFRHCITVDFPIHHWSWHRHFSMLRFSRGLFFHLERTVSMAGLMPVQTKSHRRFLNRRPRSP
jgi:hypothetical protein